jgi:hypothetical protein
MILFRLCRLAVTILGCAPNSTAHDDGMPFALFQMYKSVMWLVTPQYNMTRT